MHQKNTIEINGIEIPRLATIGNICPGCHRELTVERCETGGDQWVCDNSECSEHDSAWPV